MSPGSKLFIENIGRVLLEKGVLDKAALDRAERANRDTGERFDHILTRLGLVSEVQLARILSEYLSMPLLEKSEYPEVAVRADDLKPDFLKLNKIIPVAETETAISIGMADPFNKEAIDAIAYLTDKEVSCFLALNADFEAAVERLYEIPESAGHHQEAGDEYYSASDDIERLKDLASEAPVIQLVNQLIQQAVEQKASDIHIEPQESTIRVRFRIDGILKEVRSLQLSMQSALATRVKILGKLNIAERRKPQDGRIKIAVRGQDIDIRLSTTPTYNGESIVLRILDQNSLSLDFEALGFYGTTFQNYQKLLQEPNGIILVTGPTGSGKTTSLYTSLNAINDDKLKIFTVEDPVEYQLAGINQLQVQPKIDLTFASALRSILRQDPDIIMIGEIRDLETAQIAIQSALTGHLVLSTLHTNSASATVTRLLDMGLEDYLLASTIKGIMAQRLVRKLCDHCAEQTEPRENLIEKLKPDPDTISYVEANGGFNIRRAVGCAECNYTGFKGRTTIMELLQVNEKIQDTILAGSSQSIIETAAVTTGMKTMYQDGLIKVFLGQTTLEEVLRLTRSV